MVARERSYPSRFAKIYFGDGFSANLAGSSGVFKKQDAAIFQMDFGRLPCLASVEAIRVGIRWIPRTVEPIEVRFVIGNPLVDGDWQLVMPPHSSKNSASNLAMT